MPEKVICPHCKQQAKWADNPYRPFCSERCRLIDLGQWAQGAYKVPGEAVSSNDSGENDESTDQ